MKTHQELVDEVMDWFDFKRVAKTMEALDWTWARVNEKPLSVGTIRKHARKSLWDCLNHGYGGNGGFQTQYIDGVLTLEFVVSEWSADEQEGS